MHWPNSFALTLWSREEDLLLLPVKVVAEEFGDCAWKGRAEEFDFERSEVDRVEGFKW